MRIIRMRYSSTDFSKILIQRYGDDLIFIPNEIVVNRLLKVFFWYFQEYAQAIDILDNAYFTSSLLDVDAIRNENIAFQSDNLLHYSILKNVMLQANANNNNCSTKIGNKNTFLLR